VTLIAEELKGREVSLESICDVVIGSMIKRKAQGKSYGRRDLAEGLLEEIGEENLAEDDGGEPGEVRVDRAGRVRPPAARRDRVRAG
jgi:6-phosphofructokinase 1